jgi:hypothetical protein
MIDNAIVASTGGERSVRSPSALSAPSTVVLFPSYLVHAVPNNPGERRISRLTWATYWPRSRLR